QQARFIAVMSHEVRNAAQALVTSVDLLHQSGLDQGQRQLVNAARNAGAGLRHLLGHALDYSRLATGEYHPTPGWQDVRQLARDCLAVARPAAEAKGLAITLLQDTDPLPRMWLDGDALRQVLSNLLGNAVKFTDLGHVDVTLSLHLDQDSAHLGLSVRDTGIGIPAAARHRIQAFRAGARQSFAADGRCRARPLHLPGSGAGHGRHGAAEQRPRRGQLLRGALAGGDRSHRPLRGGAATGRAHPVAG
ncbi:MAG TPA: transcriptional regulator, partial [Stenotrophomonas sp.]|nr:transcriptional regulator [Stenotrophomonas sp.]